MNEISLIKSVFQAAVTTIVGFSIGPAIAAERINPDADEILRSMSKFLASTKSFSVSADVSNEIVAQDGQKLQLNSYAAVLVERPAHFRISRQGKFTDATLFYDGNKLTVHGKTSNVYVQLDVAGTVDDAIAAIESRAGLDFPAVDLLLSDPYSALSSGVVSSGYYGTAYVHGVECHHLAFRNDKIDWQVWIKTGSEPLPVKYVITTKWTTGAPQYSVQFTDWNTKPSIPAGRFAFVVPPGARKLEALPVDETGEVVANQESK